jgi:hypothetical protein
MKKPARPTMSDRLREAPGFPGKPGRPKKALADPPATVITLATTGTVAPRLLDLPSTARYLGCSTWTVRELEASGALPRVRASLPGGEIRKLLFDRLDLDRLIERWKA